MKRKRFDLGWLLAVFGLAAIGSIFSKPSEGVAPPVTYLPPKEIIIPPTPPVVYIPAPPVIPIVPPPPEVPTEYVCYYCGARFTDYYAYLAHVQAEQYKLFGGFPPTPGIPPEVPAPTKILLAPAAVAPAAPSQTITTVEGAPVAVTTTPVTPSTSPATGNTVTGVVTSSKSGQIAEVQVSPVGQEVIFPTQISRWTPGTPIPAGSSLHTEGGVTYVVPTETISGTTQPITVSKYDPMTNTWVNVV